VGALLGAAAVLWVSSRLTWWYSASTGITAPVAEDGAQRTPALVPLAVLAVAGVAGVVATSGWARRVVGALLVLAGLAAGWAGVAGAAEVFGARPEGFPLAEVLAGRLLAVLAGVALIISGAVLVRVGHRMPGLGAGYRAPAAARTARNRARNGDEPDDKRLWQALSDGEDPTTRDD
jgi:uncharacterized membrane protein (TIGR02234 family)